MTELSEIANLLDNTLSPDVSIVNSATLRLDLFSSLPHFPFSLLHIASGGQNQGQRIAAATYLKNLTRKHVDVDKPELNVSDEFKSQLIGALLQVEPAVLRVLVEVFRVMVNAEFVKGGSWPELVPELVAAFRSSKLVVGSGETGFSALNVLTVLQAVIRPFQYFLNPKVAKEPVPPQLELIAKEILIPMLAVFHGFVEKVLKTSGETDVETEKALLIMCKCIYLTVRSYMPSVLAPVLPTTCHDLIAVLGSLSFEGVATPEDGYFVRLKTGKRILLLFRSLVSRHRKYFDKLLPDIINCVLNIVKHCSNINNLDFLSERVISLAFDVISHILETGPGWRLVSPHFPSLLDSAIMPALVLNEKDISEWDEDADEYIRKNLPSDLDEVSGWREDLFTARKSAINLLGVIAVSKGPPMGVSGSSSSTSSKRKKGEKNKSHKLSTVGELLVLPFLSKFPIPSDDNTSATECLNDYFGVLMAYGGLQDFLSEQKPEYTTALVRSRVLPLYALSHSSPYIIATANWVLGELASCMPEEMSEEVYTSLLKALTMPDLVDISCYPVRLSAAGAIAGLIENDYLPPKWLPLLQVVVGRIGVEDEENSILFQLLCTLVEAGNEDVAVHIPYMISSLVDVISKRIPHFPEPWPQVVERGFAALSVMAQSWENFLLENDEHNEASEKWISGRNTISKGFSALLQRAWMAPTVELESNSNEEFEVSPPPSCIDDSSTLLRSIMMAITNTNSIQELKLSELFSIWADLIAEWHAWEETEDLSIFDCIKDVVTLHSKYGLKNFMEGQMPPPPSPPIPRRTIIEGICAFVSEAISQYPSATWRACSCVHTILHVPKYSPIMEGLKKSLVGTLTSAAFSHFRHIQNKPCALWKPLLLSIASCYLSCPDTVEETLEKEGGLKGWTSALGYVCKSSFEPSLSDVSEVKLIVLSLAKVVERLLESGNPDNSLLTECFALLLEASIRFKEVQERKEDDEEDDVEDEDDDEDEDTDYEDEDSEDDEHEETEEEFLKRYADAAAAMEHEIIEEGDVEDQEDGIELGCLAEVDQQRLVLSLTQQYQSVLQQTLPSELIFRTRSIFPQIF